MLHLNLAERRLTHEYFVGVLQACSEMLELRSCETGEQCPRLEWLAERLGRQMRFSPEELRDLVCGAIVHDVGKIGVPDAVLHKPDKLTEEEYRLIQQHVPLGVKRLRKLRLREEIVVIAAQHHEKYDGTGYPAGLKGSAISLAARVFTVCDAYDAMVSDRCYRKGKTHGAALQELKDYAGRQFDPRVVRTFALIPESELHSFDEVSWL